MSSIQTSIKLNDQFSGVLNNIISSVNLAVSAMYDLSQSMNADIDTSSIEGARDEINQATAAIEAMNQAASRQTWNSAKRTAWSWTRRNPGHMEHWRGGCVHRNRCWTISARSSECKRYVEHTEHHTGKDFTDRTGNGYTAGCSSSGHEHHATAVICNSAADSADWEQPGECWGRQCKCRTGTVAYAVESGYSGTKFTESGNAEHGCFCCKWCLFAFVTDCWQHRKVHPWQCGWTGAFQSGNFSRNTTGKWTDQYHQTGSCSLCQYSDSWESTEHFRRTCSDNIPFEYDEWRGSDNRWTCQHGICSSTGCKGFIQSDGWCCCPFR